MDQIFHKSDNTSNGWLSVVGIARSEPRRYGKKGELLIQYDQTDEAQEKGHGVHHQTIETKTVEARAGSDHSTDA